MQSVWLDGYFTINVPSGAMKLFTISSDFGDFGLYLFYNILTLCLSANDMTGNAVAVFITDEFISARVMSRMYI